MSYQICVDLEVYKQLTAAIESDGQTHNDVLRAILRLDSSPEESPLEYEPFERYSVVAEALAASRFPNAFYSRGLALEDGTLLRARYKGQNYRARIVGKKWIDEAGVERPSPSAAAHAITGNSVNGWRFWEGKRPHDKKWQRLDVIAGQAK
jgi:hypothetical protein